MVPPQQQAEDEHRGAQVLLDQDQSAGPPGGRRPPSVQVGGACQGKQRHGEGDLVEVEADQLLQSPGEGVRRTEHRSGRRVRDMAGRGARKSVRGDRDQGRLDDEQQFGVREEPVERRKNRQDGVEVVGEQRERVARETGRSARGTYLGGGQVPGGVRADGLFEDAQVVTRGAEDGVPAQREDGVHGEDRRGNEHRRTAITARGCRRGAQWRWCGQKHARRLADRR